jgi:hypothetical protein
MSSVPTQEIINKAQQEFYEKVNRVNKVYSIEVTYKFNINLNDSFELYYGYYNNKPIFCQYSVVGFEVDDPENSYVRLRAISYNNAVSNKATLFVHAQHLTNKRVESWEGDDFGNTRVNFSLADDLEFQEVFRTAIEIGINEELAKYEERNDLFFSLLSDCPQLEEKTEEIKKKDMRNIRRRVINKVKKHFNMKTVPFKI